MFNRFKGVFKRWWGNNQVFGDYFLLSLLTYFFIKSFINFSWKLFSKTWEFKDSKAKLKNLSFFNSFFKFLFIYLFLLNLQDFQFWSSCIWTVFTKLLNAGIPLLGFIPFTQLKRMYHLIYFLLWNIYFIHLANFCHSILNKINTKLSQFTQILTNCVYSWHWSYSYNSVPIVALFTGLEEPGKSKNDVS